MESNAGSLGPIIDEGAWLRSVQRRKVLEELIASEESYIGDMKVLVNVWALIKVLEIKLTSFHRTTLCCYHPCPHYLRKPELQSSKTSLKFCDYTRIF